MYYHFSNFIVSTLSNKTQFISKFMMLFIGDVNTVLSITFLRIHGYLRVVRALCIIK